MKTKIFSIFLILLIIFQGSIFYWVNDYYKKNLRQKEIDITKLKEDFKDKNLEAFKKNSFTEKKSIEAVSKVQNKSDIQIIGWLPDWDIPNSLESVKNNKNKFSGISPVFFWVNEDGTLQANVYTNHTQTINYAKQNNIELLPTITLFDADILTKVLNNEENLSRHVNQILENIDKYNYDGIDIDYESTYLKDKEKFLEFVVRLHDGVKLRNKKLSITVLPKWGDEVTYSTLPQTRIVQDYAQLAPFADEFRIMTYEYTGRDSKYAGPIAPIGWMEDVIQYAIYSNVPREKIVLGVHTYGYNYTQREVLPNLDHYPVFNVESDKNKPSALAQYNSHIETLPLKIEYNSQFEEAMGTYTSGSGESRIIFFMNNQAIEARKELARSYGLKGLAYWKVGEGGSIVY